MKPTILIVDDQLSAREVLRGLLADQNYRLIFAASGEEALTQAVALPPDLILLDVMMPGMDGFEVCQSLRTDPHLAEVPIMMVTSLDDRDSRLRGLEVGVDDFISKPFDALELRARIKTITRLNRYRRLVLERTYRQQAEEEVYRRNQELALLNRVILMAASALNVEEILRLGCEALAHAFELPEVIALLLDETRTQFVMMVEYTPPLARLNLEPTGLGQKESQNHRISEVLPFAGLWSEYLLEHKTPLAIVGPPTNPQLDPIYQLMLKYGFYTLLLAPILIDNETVGLIQASAAEPRRFDTADLTLAQSIATAVGHTLKTARLYQNLHQYADNLEKTIRQEQEKQAALDRLRQTFLGAVNHEMRTPLALIFQIIGMFEESYLGKLKPEQLDALMALRRQIEILSQMIESLTRTAAFLAKQEIVRPVPAFLEPVFQEVIPLVEFRARSKEITVETELMPDLPALLLDVKQMSVALTQLLDNAVKFNQPGGKIKFSARANEEWTILTISDTGMGIETEQIHRMWELFEQGVDPLRRAQEGLGLGLVLAHHIIQAHQGVIEVESTSGQGSTFTVKLPRTELANF
jgi:signal transduction histidine kinase